MIVVNKRLVLTCMRPSVQLASVLGTDSKLGLIIHCTLCFTETRRQNAERKEGV